MISPIVPSHDADTIVLDFGVFVAEHARTFRTSQSAIIAALRPVLDHNLISPLNRPEVTTSKLSVSAADSLLDGDLITTPSQPPQPAARTPAATPDVQAEEAPHSSATLSSLQTAAGATIQPNARAEGLPEISGNPEATPSPQGEAHPVPDSSKSPDETSTSQPAAEGAEGPSPIPPSHQDETLVEEATAPRDTAETGKSGDADASPAPLSAEAMRVVAIHGQEPGWPARLIARKAKLSTQKVVMLARAAGLRLPTQPAYEAAQKERIVEQLQAEPANSAPPAPLPVIPTATPQTPIAPPPVGEARTLTDRVRTLHHQHPTWTARMIANELGANPNSVSALLAGIRKAAPPPAQKPEFTGRRQMVEHYGEIAKRLGKPS